MAPIARAECPDAAQPPDDGNDPATYLVSSVAHLVWIRDANVGSLNAQLGYDYRQTASIDFTGCTWSTAIGDSDDYFLGTYDGDGNSISNLEIDESGSSNLGLFGYIGNGAEVRDLSITDASITGSSDVGILAGVTIAGASIANVSTSGSATATVSDVGGLIGQSAGVVSESSSTADVTVGSNGENAGGLVGFASGSISDSHASGQITAGSESNYIGGLVGGTTTGFSLSLSFSTGDVSGQGTAIGGLLGEAAGNVSDSYSTGSVTVSISGNDADTSIGGLIGNFRSTYTTTRSHATGDVNVSAADDAFSYYVGGLIGASAGSITQSFATGDVTLTGGAYTEEVGGLVGWFRLGSLTDSFATGAVSAPDSRGVGGLVGELDSTVRNSYSTGAVDGWEGQEGGLLGKVGGSFLGNGVSFWDTQTSAQPTSVGGDAVSGETTANMKTLTTFSNATWDIGDGWQSGETWGICDGTTYPFLIWQYDESPCSLTTPTVDTAESTSSGFTFNVTNYDSDYTYSFSATSGSASAGTASGSDLPVTVTGVSGGASSTVTVTASRTGYASSDVSLTGRATGGSSSGSGGSPSTPTPTAEPTTSPTIPTIQVNSDSLLLDPDGGPLVVAAGGAAAYSGSSELPTPEVIQDGSLWTAAGPGYALQVLGPQPLDVQQRSTTAATIPVITDGQTVAVAARGFATDATVRGWVVSRDSVPGAPPVVQFIADSTGSAIGAFQVEVLDPGPNTVQFRGLTPSGSVLTILLGLEVKPQTSVSRFAISFRTDRDTLTKRSQERLANALGAGGIPSTELNVTIRRLRADGSDGRALARERKRELRKELISLGIPRSNFDISIKSVKKPRFAKRSIVDVRHDR